MDCIVYESPGFHTLVHRELYHHTREYPALVAVGSIIVYHALPDIAGTAFHPLVSNVTVILHDDAAVFNQLAATPHLHG